MKIKLEMIPLQTTECQQMIKISDQVAQVVQDSGVENGMVSVSSMHTTAGVTVNEGVECVQSDLLAFLTELAPKQGPYRHARYLPEWGGSAANAETHVRTMLTGVSTTFPIKDGKIVKGGLQAIYFVEFDGPAVRSVAVQVVGE